MNIMRTAFFPIAIAAMMSLQSCSLMQSSSNNKPTTKKAVVAASVSVPDASKLPGEWTIYTVNGRNVTGDERPYITFDAAARRFYGSNGCNTINGNYKVDGHTLTMSDIISTMRYCPDAIYEADINRALNDARTFTISNIGNESYLTMINGAGAAVMVIRKHNMDYLNGIWQIYSINGNKVDQSAYPDLQVSFDVIERTIHGNTGCNVFNGNLLIDPDKTDAMQFTDMATTLRACPNQALETELLLALESVDRARPDGADRVTLMDAKGKPLIILQRIKQ